MKLNFNFDLYFNFNFDFNFNLNFNFVGDTILVAAELGTGNSNYTGVVYIDENILQYLSYAEFEKSNNDNKPTTYTIIEKITEFSNSAIGITMLVILPAIALAVLVLYRKKTFENEIFSGSISPINNIFRNQSCKNDENEDENENINMNNIYTKHKNKNDDINNGNENEYENENEINNNLNEDKNKNQKSKFMKYFSIDEKTLKMKIFEPIQNSYKNSLRNFISVTKVFYEKSQTNDEDEVVQEYKKKYNNGNENEIDDVEHQIFEENEHENDKENSNENENENERDIWDRKISFSKKILKGDVDEDSCTLYVDTNTNYNNENNLNVIEDYRINENNEETENQNRITDAALLLRI